MVGDFHRHRVRTGLSWAVTGTKPEVAVLNLSQSYLHMATERNKSKFVLNELVKLH